MEAGATAGQVVLETLSQLAVAEGIAHDRMTVFPALAPGRTWPEGGLEYRTLGEAIAEGWAVVTEEAQASVPELVLWNRGKAMILVLDGEEIVGGRQNRIANASFLVGAESKVVIPVSCVEHGRWRDVSDHFEPGEVSYHSLKREKHEQVRASLRATGRPVADQMAVWDEVARKHSADRVASPTGAMHALYESKGDVLAGYGRAFPYVEGAIGLVVAINGRMAGADLFDQPRTARVLWPKLVRSYALDALEGGVGEPVSRDRAVKLLGRTKGSRCEVYPSLALGEDVRLEGDGVAGSGLVYQGTPVHVSLFRIHRDQRPSAARGELARASVRRRLR